VEKRKGEELASPFKEKKKPALILAMRPKRKKKGKKGEINRLVLSSTQEGRRQFAGTLS